MAPGLESSVGIVAYLALFASVGIVFLFANLVIGRFVRPNNPTPEKLEIYECGEPTIGSSFVQFDLRFYVVALLFIIFDVEVAFFFPWATVFGKSVNLADHRLQVVATQDGVVKLTDDGRYLLEELGVRHPTVPTQTPSTLSQKVLPSGDAAATSQSIIQASSRQLAMITLIDIVAFFFILIVGFAYVWNRGDLDWVRAVSQERAQRSAANSSSVANEQLLSA